MKAPIRSRRHAPDAGFVSVWVVAGTVRLAYDPGSGGGAGK
jgi:hypothetical protein